MSKHRQRRRFARTHASLIALCRALTPEDVAYATVRFEPCGDHPHGDVVYALAEGSRVEDWADAHRTIDGDTWDSCGSPDSPQVYAMVSTLPHKGGPEAGVLAVDRLRAEGYALDLTGWPDVDEDCFSVGCKDQECPYRARQTLYYFVDHDERGEVRASVRRGWAEGEVVLELGTEEGQLNLVEYGDMTSWKDLRGLQTYLRFTGEFAPTVPLLKGSDAPLECP